MREVTYMIWIEILSQRLLKLSQKIYINKILKRSKMKNYLVGIIISIQNANKFNITQCLNNELEWE